ncbi:MFS transporter [Vallicoccus soli]|uniref:MFS transporter n=1 Tax=Vallicoccus soli TaxID=2339232 RepID=UPI0015AC68DE
MGVARRRQLLPLLLLEAATLLSGTGNGVALVALPWIALERTGSPTAAGVLAAATALPLLLSSLFSGTVVDLVGRRRTSVGSDLLSAVSVAAIPLAAAADVLSVPVLVALAMLGAVFDPAGATAREVLLPAAAERAGWRLERVNGTHEAVYGVAFLVGPGVGGLLIGLVGATTTLWVTAAGFLLSAAAVTALRLPGAGPPVEAERPAGVWRGTVEGLRFVARDPLLRAIAVVGAALVALYLPMEGVLLPTHFSALGAPERLGAVVMALSGGGVVGSLAHAQWGHRLPRRGTFVTALVLTGVSILGMAALPPFPWLLAASFATGVAYGPIQPLTNLALQRRTPERLRGRVVGILVASQYAAGPVGYLLAGPLVEAVGLRPAFLGLAVALLAVACAALLARGLHGFDDPPAGPPAPGGAAGPGQPHPVAAAPPRAHGAAPPG